VAPAPLELDAPADATVGAAAADRPIAHRHAREDAGVTPDLGDDTVLEDIAQEGCANGPL
jgi:hypothetical protein